MANKITNIKDRALLVAKYKGIAYEKFCESIGMTYGSFKGIAKSRPLNSDAIEIIITTHNDISSEWLLTGNGDMLKSSYQQESKVSIVSESSKEYIKTDNDKYIEGLERENSRLIIEIDRLHSEIELKDELLRAFRSGQIVYTPNTSQNKEKDAG